MAQKQNKLSQRPGVLLLGLDLHQLGIARSLGRRGIAVWGIDDSPYPITAFSRYCRRIKSPKLNQEDKFLDFLSNFAKKSKCKPIIFSGDRYTGYIMKHRDNIERLFEVVLPENNILNTILNKKQLYKAAMTNDIPVPQTFFPESVDDLADIAKKISFPCILKPSNTIDFYRHFRLKVFEVNNYNSLVEKFNTMRKAGYEVVVQEVIEGKDNTLYTLGSYLNRESKALAVFSGRKLRQLPVKYGVSTLSESVYEPEVVRLGIKLLQKLGYHGISQVEFKKDHRDGKLKLIEINARTWTWHMLAAACGIDLSYIAYCDKAGFGLPDINKPQKEGLKWICISTDLISAFKYLSRRELSIKECINSLTGKKKHAILAFDDPMPVVGFFFHLYSMVQHLR